MPGIEALAGMLAWQALLFGVGVCWSSGVDAASGVLTLVPFALGMRFARLRVRARLW